MVVYVLLPVSRIHLTNKLWGFRFSIHPLHHREFVHIIMHLNQYPDGPKNYQSCVYFIIDVTVKVAIPSKLRYYFANILRTLPT